MVKQVSKMRFRGKLRPGSILARFVLVLLLGLGLFLSVSPLGRAVARTALLLPAFINASEPALLKLVGEPISHTQKTISSANGPVYLDIYAPTSPVPLIGGIRQGVVVIPGVGDNRKDPQLINFSQSLAQTGIVVMDVTTPMLIQYALSPADSDAVVQAFKGLGRWPSLGANHIGIIGFSGGGALACLAAADPSIRDSVASVTLFGSYYNATSLLRDMGRRAIDVDGKLQPWRPQEVPIQVMTNTIAGQLSNFDASLLISALDPGGTPLTPSEQAELSPPALAAYHLLAGDERDKVDANIATLTQQIDALLTALSPSSVIKQIHAPIYLLHDSNDQFVPFTQSRAFDQALTQLHHPHDFAELGIFQHVEVRPDLALTQEFHDGSSLARILTEMLLANS
jgi:dienelactone hydrolase